MASKNFALVIGNGAYSSAPELLSPPLDAAEMAASLQDLGFDVTCKINLTFDAMDLSLREFLTKLRGASVNAALFYFSGHGLQIKDRNYVFPVDFEHGYPNGSVSIIDVQRDVIDQLSKVSKIRIILLDACRNGGSQQKRIAYERLMETKVRGKSIVSALDRVPIIGAGEVLSKFAAMNEGDNTFIAFATAEGQIALTGPNLSPFTAAFVKYIHSVDLPITGLTSRVRLEVSRLTENQQKPWDQSSLREPFFFNPGSMLLFTGNLMALLGLLMSFLPYSFLLTTEKSWLWIVASAMLPLISLGILLFGMQSVYSRLRGRFDVDLESEISLYDHFIASLQKGAIGGYLGSLFAGLVIGIQYYLSWARWDSIDPGNYDKLEPFGVVLLEITIATALTACAVGFLTLFFTRARINNWRFGLAPNSSTERISNRTEPSPALEMRRVRSEMSLRGILRGFCLKIGEVLRIGFADRITELVTRHPRLQQIAAAVLKVRKEVLRQFNILLGAIVGGTTAGLFAAPLLTMYFGMKSRPDMTPDILIPGAIFGTGFIIFSIVNFDFERLTLRRIRSSALAALAALGVGIVSAIVLMGALYLLGVVMWVTDFLHNHWESYLGLAAGGALYGMPVGAILGCVVGSAIVLTAKWSRDAVFGTNPWNREGISPPT